MGGKEYRYSNISQNVGIEMEKMEIQTRTKFIERVIIYY